MDKALILLVEKCCSQVGKTRIKSILENQLKRTSRQKTPLTIIANEGLHKIPERFLHGEIYVASKGNFDLSNRISIIRQYAVALARLQRKLNEHPWDGVFLIPTGHPTFALQIKNLVYHVLRIDTIDLFYAGGKYYELEIKRASFLKQGVKGRIQQRSTGAGPNGGIHPE